MGDCGKTIVVSNQPPRSFFKVKTRRSSAGLTDTRASVTLVRTAGRREWTRILCSVTASTSRVAAFLGPRLRSNVERLPPLQRKTHDDKSDAGVKRGNVCVLRFYILMMFPHLRGNGEDTGWLSSRLS